MAFRADLHLHSRFAYATSRDLSLAHLARGAARQGLHLLATGDFTHPVWRAEIEDQLQPAEEGLLRLRPDLERALEGESPAACAPDLRFVLGTEISTVFAEGGRTYKVHHLVYVPDLERAHLFSRWLAERCNVHSDGRPTARISPRDLLEQVLSLGGGSFLVPAHVWTPWFSALGSRGGYPSLEACYRDLASCIFAVETGLSADPKMMRRLSSLDALRLLSSSDAHSERSLGREATVFSCERSFPSLIQALQTGVGCEGTLEFHPEEGKYHLDGHRACGVRLEPAETRALGGTCPRCGKPVTVGVLHRIDALADRPQEAAPTLERSEHMVPLAEIAAQALGRGRGAVAVERVLAPLLEKAGPELDVLTTLPLEELRPHAPPMLIEGIARVRAGEVQVEAGFDGQYGQVKVF